MKDSLFGHKLLMISLLLCCVARVDVMSVGYEEPAFPIVWHRPDSAILYPSVVDTIASPASYTMMMVYQSLQPDKTQQLWNFSIADSSFFSMGTHQITIDQSTMAISPTSHHRNPCIYTVHHHIDTDTTNQEPISLHFGANIPQDTSHIRLFEAAYFDEHLPHRQSLMFQTYLAIKHGITLDGASYISTAGDTLWDAKQQAEFYHHIQGIGSNPDYHFISLESVSQEDSVIRISVEDTLAENNYILLGDNNLSLSWGCRTLRKLSLLNRRWRFNTIGENIASLCIHLDAGRLSGSNPDTLLLVIFDSQNSIVMRYKPDSITMEKNYHYTISSMDGDIFSFSKSDNTSIRPPHKLSPTNGSSASPHQGESCLTISPNPTDGEFVVSIELSEEKSVSVLIYDMAGRIIRSRNLRSIRSYQYRDFIGTSGVYLISVIDSDNHILASQELLVY